MKSPFPGMDPYLEANPFRAPLHFTFITAMQGELKKRVPPQYSVWPGQHIWIHEPDAQSRIKTFEPDVSLATEKPSAGGGLAVLAAPATTLLPAVLRKGNRYLEIREVRSERVVTVIELLSPANKTPGSDHDAYLSKRNEYFATETNLVEIDLLRAGRRMSLGEPAPRPADYYVLICRAAEFPQTGVWPITVRDPLPDIPIPLNPEDGVVTCRCRHALNGPTSWARLTERSITLGLRRFRCRMRMLSGPVICSKTEVPVRDTEREPTTCYTFPFPAGANPTRALRSTRSPTSTPARRWPR